MDARKTHPVERTHGVRFTETKDHGIGKKGNNCGINAGSQGIPLQVGTGKIGQLIRLKTKYSPSGCYITRFPVFFVDFFHPPIHSAPSAEIPESQVNIIWQLQVYFRISETETFTL